MNIERLIKNYYAIDPRVEWGRLEKDPYHNLEFTTTVRFLKKYLPKKGLILDAGGGPGRYSLYLAKRGYKVVLLDLAPENLDLARRFFKKEKVMHNIINVVEGSIIDLSRFKTNAFDGVLCLGGPLSHVSEEKDRIKVLKELGRVAKTRAPVVVSVMGRLGTLMRSISGWPEEIEITAHMRRLAFQGDDYMWRKKYFSHFFMREELEGLFKTANLAILESVGLEGLGSPSEEATNKLAKNKRAWKNWLEVHGTLCTHPSVVDLSLHFLMIGEK